MNYDKKRRKQRARLARKNVVQQPCVWIDEWVEVQEKEVRKRIDSGELPEVGFAWPVKDNARQLEVSVAYGMVSISKVFQEII